MGRVVIGMDPHKRSATIEVIDGREQVLAKGRYGTDTDGYQQMLAAGRAFTDRVWAVEGSYGIGRHIAPVPHPVAITVWLSHGMRGSGVAGSREAQEGTAQL